MTRVNHRSYKYAFAHELTISQANACAKELSMSVEEFHNIAYSRIADKDTFFLQHELALIASVLNKRNTAELLTHEYVHARMFPEHVK